jgi:hypothetical protein
VAGPHRGWQDHRVDRGPEPRRAPPRALVNRRWARRKAFDGPGNGSRLVRRRRAGRVAYRRRSRALRSRRPGRCVPVVDCAFRPRNGSASGRSRIRRSAMRA